ncbi:MAG: hypothetical protein QOG25_4024, partial [Acetobacteraceae bacterium]|nr:hypothetical protein [Acetobacteraceae bacterium]
RQLWRRHVGYLGRFMKMTSHADEAARLNIADRLSQAWKTLEEIEAPAYAEGLRGTIGAEPIEMYL